MAAFVVPFALNSSFTSAASAQSLSARRHLRYTGARSRRSAANYRLNRHDLIIKASVRSSEAPIELMCCDMVCCKMFYVEHWEGGKESRKFMVC